MSDAADGTSSSPRPRTHRRPLVIAASCVLVITVVGGSTGFLCWSGCQRTRSSQATEQIQASTTPDRIQLSPSPTVEPTAIPQTKQPSITSNSLGAPPSSGPVLVRVVATSAPAAPPTATDAFTLSPTLTRAVDTLKPAGVLQTKQPSLPSNSPIPPSTASPSGVPLSKSVPSSAPTFLPTTTRATDKFTLSPTTREVDTLTTLPTQAPLAPAQNTGAMVTNDCQFLDYSYAIDIYWSCGDERFNEPLRLHTFKRHSRAHQLVFADQRITYRSQQLWFDGYNNNSRCIRITGNEWRLTTRETECTMFRLLYLGGDFKVQDASTGLCAVTTSCDDDRSTGGSECGGSDHRYLPLFMGDCADDALTFKFAETAGFCSNERPGNACF